MWFCFLLFHAMRAAFLLPPIVVPDSHSLPNAGYFWGQLGGTGWIHMRDLANNLVDRKTEFWCPRTCLWPVLDTGDGALIGSQMYLDAL